MNPDTLMQSLQTGFRATVGAASSALESLQNPATRDEYLDTIQRQDWNSLIDKLVEKGEVTEQEARRFVDDLMAQQSGENPSPREPSAPTEATSVSTETETELQALTAQVATLRRELENLRETQADS
jgi:polyhydroxyalkanoate synthesis regulator phasin